MNDWHRDQGHRAENSACPFYFNIQVRLVVHARTPSMGGLLWDALALAKPQSVPQYLVQ